MKITSEMAEAVYNYGKMKYEGRIGFSEAKRLVARETGMSEGSAHRYIHSLSKMIEGEKYKSTVSIASTRIFFDNILRYYGKSGLSKAIHATRLHVEYYKSVKRQPLKSISTLCDEYTGKAE